MKKICATDINSLSYKPSVRKNHGLKTKKAIPGMERPLTIACHMKIFVLRLKHYPASWDILSSPLPK